MKMIALLPSREASFKNMRRKHNDDSQPWLEGEREVRRAGAPDGSAILCVTTEERGELLMLPQDSLHSCHDRSAQRPRNTKRVGLSNEPVGDGKSMHPGSELPRRCQRPTPGEAPMMKE